MDRFLIAVLVRNQLGVLNRVTSMFRRRQFNISSLTVSEAESSAYSRITLQTDGEESAKEQLINQLYKLPDVVSIKELNERDSVSRELLLIKIKNDATTRADMCAAADAFHAKVLDYTKDSVVYQLTDESRRIDDFIELMRDFEIVEICRTGIVALERGENNIRKVNYL
ncbi:MAG: acetolactate synthase small subunit [Clostridia bacterium]|nr:acetolactate synthase small subunit [Clostridia bacterium]